MHPRNKKPDGEIVLNQSGEMSPLVIDSMGNVYIMLKNSENDRLLNIRLEKTLVIELYRSFIEKTLSEYLGSNNRVQILSVKDAMAKVKTGQHKAENKKSLLTQREMQIMECLVLGKINKEIASEFGLSTNTVRNHLRSIYTKLDVENRTEAILKYMYENL